MRTRPVLFDLLEKVRVNFPQGVIPEVFAMIDYAGLSLKRMNIFKNSSFIGS